MASRVVTIPSLHFLLKTSPTMPSIHEMPTGLVLRIVLTSVVRSLRSIRQTAEQTLWMSLHSGSSVLPSLRKFVGTLPLHIFVNTCPRHSMDGAADLGEELITTCDEASRNVPKKMVSEPQSTKCALRVRAPWVYRSKPGTFEWYTANYSELQYCTCNTRNHGTFEDKD